MVAIFLWRGLSLDPHLIPSALLNSPSPQFSLNSLTGSQQKFDNEDLLGHVSLVNVWASWCDTCLEEEPVLLEIAQSNKVKLYGINYKDQNSAALKWLSQYGNPYQKIGTDHDGAVGINWGVYGTPETFVLDKKGIIRYKYIGAITDEVWQDKLLPIINQLNN